ncbi:MAG: energy transducer TonB [Balneolaceae bacterium]
MLSLICTELLILLLIKLWPTFPPEQKSFPDNFTEDVVFIEKAIVTRQTSAPAAPPKPRIPVPVPNDEIIEEEINFPDFDDIVSIFDAEGDEGTSLVGGEGDLVGSPEQPPGLIRIVEPTIPDAAKRANLKARIKVTFLVGTNGEVEDAYISEIRVYNGNDYEIVKQIGYGLMEATLDAASKWKFRPARDQGVPVKTYVENSFNIGF